MKKLFLPLFAMSLLFVASCSEEFDVAAPYRDITVVYGFLDMGDTAHYIRIQKAFLDQNQSAITMAKESDSSFYSNISVRVERHRISGNNAYVDSIHLERVDLNDEGYPKEPGAFFNSPNYAYKFTNALDPQFFYRLKITNLTTGKVDSADAPVIDNSLSAFNVRPIDDTSVNLYGMRFYSTLPNRYYSIDMQFNPPANYSVNGYTSPASIAQAVIRFNWNDSNIVEKTSVPRSFDFNAGYLGFSSSNFEYKIDNLALYSAIRDGMGAAPDNVIRLMNRCQMFVYLSTPEFANYRQALLVQGNGITGNEIAPIYTNVKGENTLGLFTARAAHSGYITIDNQTMDSLMSSSLLASSKIKGTVY